MKTTKLLTSLMLSATILGTATPTVLAANTASSSITTSSVKTSASSSSSQKTTAKQESKKDESKTESVKADRIQTLTEQTMIIHKIIAKDGSVPASVTAASNKDSKVSQATPGVKKSDFKGVNGATFKVYDATELMNTIIKEQLVKDEKATDKEAQKAVEEADKTDTNATTTNAEKVDKESSTTSSKVESEKASNASSETTKEKSSSVTSVSASNSSASTSSEKESSTDTSSSSGSSTKDTKESELVKKVEEMRKNDSLRKEIADRASKMNDKQLKEVTTVKTSHDKELNTDGVARVKVPLDGKYHAYYVVNTDTPKETLATNSAPIVVITPITDEQGEYAPDFTIYPKSNLEEVTKAKMVQTGHVSLWDQFTSWVKSLF